MPGELGSRSKDSRCKPAYRNGYIAYASYIYSNKHLASFRHDSWANIETIWNARRNDYCLPGNIGNSPSIQFIIQRLSPGL